MSDAFDHMQTVKEEQMVDTFSLGLGGLPSPFDADSEDMVSLSHTDTPLHSDYDWATFISAYASGRWDPHRTPNPPRSYATSSSGFSLSPEVLYPEALSTSSSSESLADTRPQAPLPVTTETEAFRAAGPSTSTLPISPSASIKRFRPTAPTSIGPLTLPPHRMRSSFSTSSAPLPSSGESGITSTATPGTHTPSNAEVQTTVATLRWAAARVDISPLALPSPEHELTDPMRGVTAAVPGSHSSFDLGPDYPSTPGGTRKPRLGDFWHGTTDVDKDSPVYETLVDDSPETAVQMLADSSPVQEEASQRSRSVPLPSPLFSGMADMIPTAIPAASAPHAYTYHGSNELLPSDYFGDSVLPRDSPPPSSLDLTQPQPDADTNTTTKPYPEPNGSATQDAQPSTTIVPQRRSPSPDLEMMTVPALPRRVCLTRQTSSPLPTSTPLSMRQARLPGGRVQGESIAKGGRAAKEEQMYVELGYLAPPNPPDELERRRALYKFNIWNTGPDLNFDRIAHLAKLVFSTKGVVVSLIDGNEHGDEPMVILDTHLDWRFAKNPLVVGAPHIRFYAGAPLRTADGFNIGTLAVICDNPREDFSPRQKHTLKEFAAIAMREMELWRDKIQLRIRDRIQNSMEQFSRECLEIDTEAASGSEGDRLDLIVGSSMDKVYDRAAKLVKRTLDVEGVIVMDVSHCEVLESMSAEGTVSVIMHYGDPQVQATVRQLSSEEYHKLNAFFAKYPDGKISEGIVPPSFRPFLPTHIQYALTVPIFNIDKRPFALLCAYNGSDQTKRFILAAAELLSDSNLNHSQLSFLQTVQACGTSLVETVNHVLDFTKLSGNSKAGGVENVIVPSKSVPSSFCSTSQALNQYLYTRVDLMQLVEEAVDGCWIGHRARTAIMRDSGIGSVYSPPKEEHGLPVASHRFPVETIIDIGYRREGWALKCEKGGIRRVLMNVFGNSLKFTMDGFVHVILRQLPQADGDPPDRVRIELAVLDTGKGISQNFLKNQLFHPFSQENPLQTGTGLGLAIVNSIVRSESVGGKVEVWSEEGTGTEIRVTFFAEKSDDDEAAPEMEPFKFGGLKAPPTVSLVGFDTSYEGVKILKRVLEDDLKTWWGFDIYTGTGYGDIVILNNDPSLVQEATGRRDTSRPFIIFSAARGNPTIMTIASDHERIGGFCRVFFKPGGPSRLWAILKLCLHAHKIGSRSRGASPTRKLANVSSTASPAPAVDEKERSAPGASIPRRKSEESHSSWSRSFPSRPPMSLRSSTIHPTSATWRSLSSTSERGETPSSTPVSTIPVGPGGSLLKSSLGAEFHPSGKNFRVLVVEDNSILRNLLVVLLDLSMPVLDGKKDACDNLDIQLLTPMAHITGVAATAEIRLIESQRAANLEARDGAARPSRILALTGMSSLEDKRRAFEAGVDG
ncbi:hypothetical protein DXG03_005824 [Asterophora parasitica]|uniref:histidine kinase n=1 Tax=Asterophora parasitica TaxID=117018 RepID=A0A9P7G7Y8_9AGAR|nr:hypothetical protein DXG03_005824 [Asterophora parasitica]